MCVVVVCDYVGTMLTYVVISLLLLATTFAE